MIEYAGVGVAMGNAIPELKAVAQFVTSANTEDGVARAIEKFVLNGWLRRCGFILPPTPLGDLQILESPAR